MRSSNGVKKLILFAVVGIIVILVGILFTVQIIDNNRKNAVLQSRKERLEQLIEEEKQRRLDLEDEEVYVQTRKYIEEKAKSIGYVYPDEIIFKEDD